MGAVVLDAFAQTPAFERRLLLVQHPEISGVPIPGSGGSIPISSRRRTLAGNISLYVGDYLEPEHEYFHLTKEELLEKFAPA